jgi:hypothetical protein
MLFVFFKNNYALSNERHLAPYQTIFWSFLLIYSF